MISEGFLEPHFFAGFSGGRVPEYIRLNPRVLEIVRELAKLMGAKIGI